MEYILGMANKVVNRQGFYTVNNDLKVKSGYLVDGETRLTPGQLLYLETTKNLVLTTNAIRYATEAGCPIFVVGKNVSTISSIGSNGKNVPHQSESWSNRRTRIKVARTLLEQQIGKRPKGNTIATLRGWEGNQMKNVYQTLSQKHEKEWKGRKNKDQTNLFISIHNKRLYILAHCVISALGYSPHLGYMHTGVNGLAFDLADTQKIAYSLEPAFNKETVRSIFQAGNQQQVVSNMVETMKEIL